MTEDDGIDLADPTTWGQDYVDLRRPEAILAGLVDQAYGHVQADSPLIVWLMTGTGQEYSSVDEMLADGWEIE